MLYPYVGYAKLEDHPPGTFPTLTAAGQDPNIPDRLTVDTYAA
jgi:hypothetical protein